MFWLAVFQAFFERGRESGRNDTIKG